MLSNSMAPTSGQHANVEERGRLGQPKPELVPKTPSHQVDLRPLDLTNPEFEFDPRRLSSTDRHTYEFWWTPMRRGAISGGAPTLLESPSFRTSALDYRLDTSTRRRVAPSQVKPVDERQPAHQPPPRQDEDDEDGSSIPSPTGSEILRLLSEGPPPCPLNGNPLVRKSGILSKIISKRCITIITALFGGTATISLLAAFSLGVRSRPRSESPAPVTPLYADSDFLYCLSASLLLILGAYMALVALLRNTHRVKAQMWKWIGVWLSSFSTFVLAISSVFTYKSTEAGSLLLAGLGNGLQVAVVFFGLLIVSEKTDGERGSDMPLSEYRGDGAS